MEHSERLHTFMEYDLRPAKRSRPLSSYELGISYREMAEPQETKLLNKILSRLARLFRELFSGLSANCIVFLYRIFSPLCLVSSF